MRITLTKRLVPSRYVIFLLPILSILAALVVGGVLIYILGQNPLIAYRQMFSGALGSWYSISETIVTAIPLLFCSLAVAIATRMQLWNIGVEGQLVMGAVAAGVVGLSVSPEAGFYFIFPIIIAGMIGGVLWALVPAILKATFSVSEIVTTLLLNYVAIKILNWLCFGPWKGMDGFQYSRYFSPYLSLPTLGTTRAHIGIFLAVFLAVLIYLIIVYTRFGFELRVQGDNQRAARYAGINLKKNIILVMAISGAIAGLAGVIQVTGYHHRIEPAIASGYGYTAIIVAWLSKNHPLVILPISFLIGALLVGGEMITGVPTALIGVINGLIFFFILAGELFVDYKFQWISKK